MDSPALSMWQEGRSTENLRKELLETLKRRSSVKLARTEWLLPPNCPNAARGGAERAQWSYASTFHVLETRPRSTRLYRRGQTLGDPRSSQNDCACGLSGKLSRNWLSDTLDPLKVKTVQNDCAGKSTELFNSALARCFWVFKSLCRNPAVWQKPRTLFARQPLQPRFEQVTYPPWHTTPPILLRSNPGSAAAVCCLR